MLDNRLLFIFFLVVFPFFVGAQNPTSGDCSNAIVLESKIEFKSNTVSGPGNVVEIANNELGNPYFFTEEKNTIWYSIVAPYDGLLTFDIIPNKEDDDWDFLVFDHTENICQDISSKKQKPVRSNLARNNAENKGKTGLSEDAIKRFETAGPNPNYSKALEVQTGQRFIIVADNNSIGGNGHTVKLNYKKIEKKVEPSKDSVPETNILKEAKKWVSTAPKVAKTTYNFTLLDKNTKKPLICNAEIILEKSGFGNDSTIRFTKTSQFTATIVNGKNFSLNVKKDEYLFIAKNYRAFRVDSVVNETLLLAPAEAGEMLSLPDINFKENTTHLLSNSINALIQIKDFMNKNPNAIIEIRGHVNAPGYPNEGKVKRFSEKRAAAIKDFLVGEGIDGKRMKAIGMGNEFMIYPTPVSYHQQKANRRVEIVILKN